MAIADSGAVDVNGNQLNKVITGNDWNNVIDGLGGADLMSGNGGNNTYIVDNVGGE